MTRDIVLAPTIRFGQYWAREWGLRDPLIVTDRNADRLLRGYRDVVLHVAGYPNATTIHIATELVREGWATWGHVQ